MGGTRTDAGTDSGTSTVTVFGLGLMGQALASAMLVGDRETTVWNRTPGRADALVERGAREAADVRRAVEAGDLLIVCVRDYRAVREFLDPVADALSGRTVVNLTSGSSAEAREMAAWAAGHGAAYLDGAIMMTPPGIGLPDTVLLYAGPADVFAAHEDTLRLLGGGTTHLSEDTGIASLYDVALLGIMWGSLNGFVHAAALLAADGVTAKEFLPFATSWLGAIGVFTGVVADQVDSGDFAAVDASLASHLSPVEHLIDESRARGIDASLPEFTRGLLTAAIARGQSGDGYARLIEHFRPGQA
ncbi:NAD(P)-dependent oxidoreductase [Streptomyces sp. NPDC048603]|uniref:NAD(P)-dependent oxidoreductase n=1 Tax=Streptomyces sp. NPDC048603 TaxID=3365577 RepID=UPI003723BDE4